MNAPTTHNGTAVAHRNTFSAFMASDGIRRKISEIIGSKKGDSFVTSIVSSVSNNPALAACDNGTILSAGLQGAALDLSPSPSLGHFYMVPFEDRKNNRTVATFQLGYKGYIQLAIRSGQYRRINVIAIKNGELVNWNPLTEEIYTKLIDDDETRESAPTTGYYATFELVNGFVKTMYWSRAKMESHAMRYSKGYAAKKGYTFWEKDFDGMAFKTMLRQLLSKWGVMSIELQKAYESDTAVIDANGTPSYIDNEPVAEQQGQGEKKEPAAYPQADFDKNLPNWTKLITDGKKTPEQIIAMISSKGIPTEEQRATLRALKPAAPTGEMTEAEIAEARAREMAEAGK